jgi:hypothetical protein
MPCLDEAEGKIVRVNSGHDSNLHRNYVIAATEPYRHKFYNTSIPDFDFPAPVIFTCNPKDTEFIRAEVTSNLMAVRIRVSTWMDYLDDAICYYTSRGVPVILTFMRYKDKSAIDADYVCDYQENVKHVTNRYWMIRPEAWMAVVARYPHNMLVFSCGSPASSLCKDCGNCERLYWIAKDRIRMP